MVAVTNEAGLMRPRTGRRLTSRGFDAAISMKDNRLLGRWWPPLSLGLTLAGVLIGLHYIAHLASTGGGEPNDLHAYYVVDLADIYARPLSGTIDAYTYTPAFAQAFEPLAQMPFEILATVWRLILLGAVAAMAGPLTLPVLFWSPVLSEINVGNVHILMALAVWLGFRYPMAWTFVLLTKVTPGIGLLWFVGRREWHRLGIVLVATSVMVCLSIALSPTAWRDWVDMLLLNLGQSAGWRPVPIPLWLTVPAPPQSRCGAPAPIGLRRWPSPLSSRSRSSTSLRSPCCWL
jgi:hypothetical protein